MPECAWPGSASPAGETYRTPFLGILRGVALRGADTIDLAPYIAGLAICCAVILSLSLARFRKQLA